ncbi:hypothetical protein CKALI_06965 [Corynebacterium kalinowskii]|uniref:YlxR domain-containing protein n=1 Tax=Corynebacterium kalinowskii TaxID=2675216 RepID=A0A6B8VTF0_9CORY|nr:YlxR family protein [Corynebacterium kalinowskii]QGU02255.1 hypothetical protein CKALI_06965 [Corynebacterium kalinowskii]
MTQSQLLSPGKTERLRTCIATRKTLPDFQLLRTVLSTSEPNVVVPDLERKFPGRGAWITPTLEALDTAEQRKAFGRAFKVSSLLDTRLVRQYLLDTTTKQEGLQH